MKLGDFGLAVRLNSYSEHRSTICGTPNYIAPEIISGKNEYSFGVDVWAFGVILWAMVFGRAPFETKDLKLTYDKIKGANFSYPDNKASKEFKDLIEKIFVSDPLKRITISQIIEHPFFKTDEIPSYMEEETLTKQPKPK